ncbi:MAG: phosphatase PAP2 family protein [Clostridia bacterium]|nr:phosphatase PAP2 family protein [Clostridia bacterium]
MEILYFLEGLRMPVFDVFFSLITHFGEETLFIIIGLLFFWCIDKKEGYYLLCVGLLGTVVNQFLKLLFRIPRPWVRNPEFTIVESARAEATGYSFPSGHTQTSVGVYGGIARWTGKSLLSTLCLALCVLVPLSRMYLGVHTPADVGVSIVLALVLIFAVHPIVYKGFETPKTMRALLGCMTLLALGNLAFVSLYSFPADVDADNLAHGIKNAYTMLGCVLGLLASYEADRRYIRFVTKGSLRLQAAKLIPGMLLLLAIKSGLKAPLYALTGGHYVADAIRYFVVVAFAGCLWPLTFPWFSRKFGK